MKSAKLLHNPEAGEGDLKKKDLIALIESAGYDCSYSSTKKEGWEKFEPGEIDFLVLAGGDGTVRKVAGELLERKRLDKLLPIGLLPFGTANNIAKSLGIKGKVRDIIQSWTAWNESNIKGFDVGRIDGLDKIEFFLESFGFGVFPYLMEKMKDQKQKYVSAEENMKAALKLLLEIAEAHQSCYCKLQIDEIDYSGNFILIEIMNTSSIGPNLILAPDADPGDGEFDVVLITEQQREDFSMYIENKLKGVEQPPVFKILKAKTVEVFWDEPFVHVDDENIKMKNPVSIKVELLTGLLQFLV